MATPSSANDPGHPRVSDRKLDTASSRGIGAGSECIELAMKRQTRFVVETGRQGNDIDGPSQSIAAILCAGWPEHRFHTLHLAGLKERQVLIGTKAVNRVV